MRSQRGSRRCGRPRWRPRRGGRRRPRLRQRQPPRKRPGTASRLKPRPPRSPRPPHHQARKRVSDVAYKPTPAEVKQLRDATQAGMMDCKRALEESSGDMDAAKKWLREKGLAAAGKRAGRGTGAGVVESYIHATGTIGAMVEVGCETDFVARNETFKAFARDVALQIAAGRSLLFVSEDEIPEDFRAS